MNEESVETLENPETLPEGGIPETLQDGETPENLDALDASAYGEMASGEAYAGDPFSGLMNSLLDQIELPLEVRLGQEVWSLERVLGLKAGDAVPVGGEGEDSVTLYVQDRPYAMGDLVVVDGKFAFRVRELIQSAGGGL